jgi:hypothetical protein
MLAAICAALAGCDATVMEPVMSRNQTPSCVNIIRFSCISLSPFRNPTPMILLCTVADFVFHHFCRLPAVVHSGMLQELAGHAPGSACVRLSRVSMKA